jgi:predicted alpha-1,2-mannosidase
VDKVNPLQGTDSSFEVSTGNTYPAVALPWGMNFWTPQTGVMGSGWQYVYKDSVIRGFKQTHQPSPWINDYGCFALMPITGKLAVEEDARQSPFAHAEEIALPCYYRVHLQKYRIQAEMTATNSGAVFRFTYPPSGEAYVLVDAYKNGSHVKIIPHERKVVGYAGYYAKDDTAPLPDNFASWFVVEFDRDFTACGSWKDNTVGSATEATGGHTGAYLRFDVSEGETITARVASSFIGREQAQVNFDREVAGKSFEEVMTGARKAWERELNRIRVRGGTDEQQKTFYTALYRTMLFPRKLHEYNKNGEMVHYSAMNGEVRPGAMYTDNGFWDTFRAVHPFFTIMYPAMSGEIMQALINYYDEGGWMPEWCSPGYRNCMIGQHSTSLVCDAYMKGIRNFDTQKAWAAMEKGANREGPIPAVGRDGCAFYNRLGYIPCDVDKRESVSKTLEYAYNDFCMARFAAQTGLPDETVNLYARRAQNYRNVFDPSISFVRPKDSRGRWQTPYRPDSWGGAFTEGSAWHWTWCVYHDIQGLIDLMGGDRQFVRMLDSVFVAEPTFEFSAYGGVIHEMTEMVLCRMGQYAHGNQPIQHGAYLFNHAGQPWKSQRWVRHIMDTQYDASQSGLCGDEDNGQTSAWYVFSALGFYPVTPGQPEYVIGSPLFDEAVLQLPSGKTFTVKAVNNSPRNVYIQSAKLNGKVFERTYIRHDEIVNGGVLEFVMGDAPNVKWGTSPEARPFSMSKK